MRAPDTSGPPVVAPHADASPDAAPDAGLPRVLHLRSSCGLYGAEGVIRGLVRAYAGPSSVLCFADAREPHTELCDLLRGEGFQAGALPSRGAADPAVVLRLAAALRRLRPHVLHTHDYKSDAVAWLATRLLRRRPALVATMHGVVRATAALERYERLDARVLRRFDAVVAVSDGTAEIARSYGIRPARLNVIANGVDTDAFRPAERAGARRALGLPPDGPLIGVVGRLSPEKGHAVLLDALDAMHVSARLIVVGDGPLEAELQARAGDRVHFLGRREDVAALYPALDVLALPSHTEGLPLTVLEAASCGIPVVASRVGDVARVVRPGETGALVPPGDATALARALDEMLADAGRRERMGRAARALVTDSFSVRANADAYADLYRRVARRQAEEPRRSATVSSPQEPAR